MADTGEAARTTASVPEQAKAAKPAAGRAIESDSADTPAKRAKEGEQPVNPPTARAPRTLEGHRAQPRQDDFGRGSAEFEILRGDTVEAGGRQGCASLPDHAGCRNAAF